MKTYQGRELKVFLHYIIKNKLYNQVESNWFSDHEDVKNAFIVIKTHYDKYQTLPDFDTMMIYFNENNFKTSKSSLSDILQEPNSNESKEWIQERFTDWFSYYTASDELKKKLDDLKSGLYKITTPATTSLTIHYDPNKKYDEKPYLLYPIIKKGQLGIVFGSSGQGKSIFAMECANFIAKGRSDWDFFRVDTPPQKVLYIDFELGPESIQSRYKAGKFSDNLIIKCVDNYEYNKWVGFTGKLFDRLTKAIQFIKDEVSKNIGISVIFIDNLSNIADQTEKASDADMFVSNLYGELKKNGYTIFFVGHTPKLPENSKLSQNQLKGSSSLPKTFESIIGFKRSKEKDISYIKQVKARDLEEVFDENNVGKFEFVIDDEIGWKLNFIGTEYEQDLLPDEREKNGGKNKIDNLKRVSALYDYYENKLTQKEILLKYSISKMSLSNFKRELELDKYNLKVEYQKYKTEQNLAKSKLE